MAIIQKQESQRSDLQKRIGAELSEKAKNKHKAADERPDGVDDSAYMQDKKQTTSLAWVWLLIVAAALAVMFWYLFASGNPA